jgi:hypothetical protein
MALLADLFIRLKALLRLIINEGLGRRKTGILKVFFFWNLKFGLCDKVFNDGNRHKICFIILNDTPTIGRAEQGRGNTVNATGAPTARGANSYLKTFFRSIAPCGGGRTKGFPRPWAGL